MWETIVWIFYNVIPWIWLVTTVIYLIISAFIASSEEEKYNDAWDFMLETAGISAVVNIIGFLIVFAVALLTDFFKNIIRANARKRQKS